MPKGRVEPREVTCRACSAAFTSERTGKAAYYCHQPTCDERRERERIVVANPHGRYGDRAAYRARMEAKRRRALLRHLTALLRKRKRAIDTAEREAYREQRAREAASRRRATAQRRARERRVREERELERLRARLIRIEPVARARRDELVDVIRRIAELEHRPVEVPAWMAGGEALTDSERRRLALATDLLAVYASTGAAAGDDEHLAELAIAVVRGGASSRGRAACVSLAGAALARALALDVALARRAA